MDEALGLGLGAAVVKAGVRPAGAGTARVGAASGTSMTKLGGGKPAKKWYQRPIVWLLGAAVLGGGYLLLRRKKSPLG